VSSSHESEVSRAQTDVSLRAERERSDDELLARSLALDEQSDEAIERAREQARRVLELARARADRHLRDIGGTAQLTAALAAERRAEDSLLTTEHAQADAERVDERVQRRAAIIQILAHERVITDDALHTERTLEDRRAELHEDVLAGVAHDLRTLLTTVAVNASIVLLAPDLGTVRGAGALIQRAGAQMAEMLENLLDVVSLDGAQWSLAKTETDLVSLARDVLAPHEHVARLHAVSLALHPQADALTARVDARRVKRLLINLVANALKFTPDGGRIDVDLSIVDAEYELAVRDSGPGIPRDQLQAIFERFHRLGGGAGFGLGLYICRRIAEAHGGRIWAESDAGAGATFRVRLPRG
jgi:signal transduction histidine kinase